MRLLVIDTALGACAAGVFDGARALATASEAMTRGHQERIGPLVRDVMTEAGLSFAEVERIGVTVGPGSFTGLRVGLAFAKGLGMALGRPVVGVSTLDALAASAPPDGVLDTVALVDGRRGQVYLRVFRNGQGRTEPEALDLDAAGALIETLGPIRLVGDGAPVLLAAVPQLSHLRIEPVTTPTLAAVSGLAAGIDPALAPANPLYLRGPDAVVATRLPGQPRRPVTRP